MATEAERYLRKARESLASEDGCPRQAQQLCSEPGLLPAFQAEVAALIWQDVRPDGLWQHKFVASQFSGKLIRRRKALPSKLGSTIDELFRLRVTADYESEDVSRTNAENGFRKAVKFVEEIDKAMKRTEFREASADYATSPSSAFADDRAAERIAEIQKLITSKYPESQFEVIRFGPADYRLNAYIKPRSYAAFNRLLGSWTSDVLVDDEIWIVVIPRPLEAWSGN